MVHILIKNWWKGKTKQNMWNIKENENNVFFKKCSCRWEMGMKQNFSYAWLEKKASLLVICLKRHRGIQETFFILIETGIQVPVPQKGWPQYTTGYSHGAQLTGGGNSHSRQAVSSDCNFSQHVLSKCINNRSGRRLDVRWGKKDKHI